MQTALNPTEILDVGWLEFPPQVYDEQEEEEDVSIVSEAAKKAQKYALISTVTAVVMVILAAFGQGYTIYHDHTVGRSVDGRLTGIETSLRLLTQTVAPQLYEAVDDSLHNALVMPAPEAAKALDGAQASLKQLQELKVAPDTRQLNSSAALLANVTLVHPELGESWAASGQLISYRSSLEPTASTRSCYDAAAYNPQPDIAPDADFVFVHTFSNCTLVRSEEIAYVKSRGYQRFLAGLPHHPSNMAITLLLDNVHVVYRGGTLINVASFVFHNCTFEFSLPATPPDQGKHLIRELLTANPNEPIKVSVAG